MHKASCHQDMRWKLNAIRPQISTSSSGSLIPSHALVNTTNSYCAVTASSSVMSSFAEPVIEAIYFDALQWANSPASNDLFYQVPDDTSKAIPGSILKAELNTNINRYSLPPATTLTRFA